MVIYWILALQNESGNYEYSFLYVKVPRFGIIVVDECQEVQKVRLEQQDIVAV